MQIKTPPSPLDGVSTSKSIPIHKTASQATQRTRFGGAEAKPSNEIQTGDIRAFANSIGTTHTGRKKKETGKLCWGVKVSTGL